MLSHGEIDTPSAPDLISLSQSPFTSVIYHHVASLVTETIDMTQSGLIRMKPSILFDIWRRKSIFL